MNTNKLAIIKTHKNMEANQESLPICPECGGTDIEILENEDAAICHHCWLEWPYIIAE